MSAVRLSEDLARAEHNGVQLYRAMGMGDCHSHHNEICAYRRRGNRNPLEGGCSLPCTIARCGAADIPVVNLREPYFVWLR